MNTNRDKAVSFGRDGGDVRRPVFFVNEPELYVTSVPAPGAMSLFGIPDPPASLLRRFSVRVEHEDGTPLPSGFLSGVQTDGVVYHCVRSARGRADAVVKTPQYIYVFEFKLGGTVEEALKQIDDKGYLIPYQRDGREVVKVGVEFSAEERNIARWLCE